MLHTLLEGHKEPAPVGVTVQVLPPSGHARSLCQLTLEGAPPTQSVAHQLPTHCHTHLHKRTLPVTCPYECCCQTSFLLYVIQSHYDIFSG